MVREKLICKRSLLICVLGLPWTELNYKSLYIVKSKLLPIKPHPLFFMAGVQTFPNENLRLVDVRDVGNAHIEAFERPSASGRYCLVARVTHVSEVLKIVHEHYPTLQLPER